MSLAPSLLLRTRLAVPRFSRSLSTRSLSTRALASGLASSTARPRSMAPSLSLSRSEHTVSGPAGEVAAPRSVSGEASSGSRDIDASALILNPTASRKAPPPSSALVFGHTFSDHMLSIPWSSSSGWAAPEIKAYGPLVLDPSSVIFHYAPSLFEGMKAYKDVEGKVRLFRPDMNMKRMNRSAERIALPTFSGDELIRLIAKLVKLDSSWIPSEPGHSLYIRPALIGTQAALGVHPTTDALLFVISSPVGPYYKTGFKPVALEADPSRVRAWPGGTGNYKLGSNYAPGIRPQMEAATRGYQQNLWLFGEEHWLTEVGTMNLFVVLKKGDGIELVTPPLDGMILPGVTRDSILSLARDHAAGRGPALEGLPKHVTVSERGIHMGEVQAAEKDGSLLEIFGAGTAAVVSPVDRIGYMGKDIHVPVGESGVGPVAKAMLQRIQDIQLGRVEHEWSVLVDDLV